MKSTRTPCPLPRKLLPAAILGVLASAAPLAVHATALSVASYDVDVATAGPPPIGPTGTLGSGSFSDPLDVLHFSSPGGVDVGIHTFGQPDGSFFGSRSSGDINGSDRAFRVDGEFTLMLDDFASSTLNFNIIPGQVRAQGAPSGGSGLQPGDFLMADLVLSIMSRVGTSTDDNDFVEIFGTQASAIVDDTGAMVTWSGNDIGFNCAMNTTTPGGSLAACSFSGGAHSLALGAGTWDIKYTLSSVAAGSVSFVAGECGFGGGDDGGGDVGSGDFAAAFFGDGGNGFGGGPCRAVAQIGDPLAFVPEPATLGLIALGLAAAGRARRRSAAATSA